MDDIFSITLVPAWESPDVQTRLAASIARADLLQAAAYWTVDSSLLGHELTNRISPPHGSLCVDLHRPTEIDALACLVRGGAAVRVNQRMAQLQYRRDGLSHCQHLVPPRFRGADVFHDAKRWNDKLLSSTSARLRRGLQVRKFELVSLVAAILLAKRERINVSQQEMEVAVDEAIQIIALTEKKLGYTTGQR